MSKSNKQPEAPAKLEGQASLAAASGSAAPFIRHGFNMKLTREQGKELQKIWTEHGQDGAMIIMQPILNWGPFDVTNKVLNAAVLDKRCAKAIHAVIDMAKQQNSIY